MITRALLAVGLAASLVACSSSGSGHHTSTADLANKYLAIATPANAVLDKNFDALEDHDDDLALSAGLLKTIAATERGFDRDLLALALPDQLGVTATALVRVNEARATLTTQAMTATTVASLKSYEVRLDAMNEPVEVQVRILRKDLGLPPPDTD